MANKIIQMWEESSHTTALYPTSVAEAIKWDSTQTIAQYIANNVGFYGIDTSRIIASNPQIPYTATEDCYVYCGASANNGIGYYFTIYIDNVIVDYNGNTNAGYVEEIHPIPLKKGQTMTTRRGNAGNTNDSVAQGGIKAVYGIKH